MKLPILSTIKRRYIEVILILLHVTFAVVGFYTYFYNYRLSESVLKQRSSEKQLILAKAGALSLENFFDNIQNQLFSFVFSFAKIDEAAPIDLVSAQRGFREYIGRSGSPILGIALYDGEGNLLILEENQTGPIDKTINFSSYDFLQWSKNSDNSRKVYISNPYTARTGGSVGKTIMVVAKPLYFGNRFKGTVAIRFSLSQFIDTFINPLGPGVGEDSFIVDTQGVLLAGNNNLINKNLLQYAQETKWQGSDDFVDTLTGALRKNTTTTQWSFKMPGEKVRPFSVGISKIDVPNTEKDLYMVVTSSQEDVASALTPLRFYGIAWLGFGILTTSIGSALILILRYSK